MTRLYFKSQFDEMMLISRVFTLGSDAPNKKMPRFSSPASFLGRRSFYCFYLAVVLCAFASRAPIAEAQLFSYAGGCRRCVSGYSAATDYFPVKVSPDNSLDWSVTYFNHYKVITNNRATKGVTTFYAYLCGTPIPSIPPGVNAIALEIPLRNYALVSTTHAGYFEQIAQLGTFSAFAFQSYYFSNNGLPCSTTLSSSNVVAFNENAPFPEPQDLTDAFFEDVTSPGGAHAERSLDAIFVDNYWGEAQQYSRIPEAKRDNAAVIEISESLSDNPIQHLEWVEFVSMFFNKESLAASIADSAKALYDCHKNSVSGGTPSVLYLSACPNPTFGITQYSLGESSGEFYNTLIADAGGAKVDPVTLGGSDSGGVTVAQFESFFNNESNAVDIVIAAVNINNCNLNLAAFQNSRTFGLEQSSGVNVWFGARFLLPDRTLFEFISMIKNPTVLPNPKRIMFKRADAAVNDFQAVPLGSCSFDSSFDLRSLSVGCGGNTIPEATDISDNALTCGAPYAQSSMLLAAVCLLFINNL